jgi:hypothetical protein
VRKEGGSSAAGQFRFQKEKPRQGTGLKAQPWLKIEQFVTAITAKARHSGYAMRMYDEKGETL